MNEKNDKKLFYSNSDKYARNFYDSLLIAPSYIGADLPSTNVSFFGKTFESPVMIAPFAAMVANRDLGAYGLALAAKETKTLYWATHLEGDELKRIAAEKIPFVKNSKPLRDHDALRDRIKQAEQEGAAAFFIDVDQQFKSSTGTWDNFGDRPDYIPDQCGGIAGTQTVEDLWSYAHCCSLPVVIKGILSVHDAMLCKEAGIAAVYVSHHHGVLQYAVPPALAVQTIRQAVGPDYTIFVDSGIESGIDAYKALALGANGAFVARHLIPYYRDEGTDGVVRRLREMTTELKYYMGITGAGQVKEISAGSIVRKTF